MISLCIIFFYVLLMISLSLFMNCLYFIINDYVLLIEWDLLMLNSSCITMTILFDWMSLLFMSFVLLISSMVIYYSNDYMSDDKNLNRFIMLVLMFVLSMMFLIVSPNLISILLGWDGLGLVSYCLVIYYQNEKSYNAGMLTVLSNRIGDVALLLSIAWMLNFGSWNYIFYLESMKMSFEMQFISYMIVLAALTKSAQIPFSSWLPAAMAAPTPVSALVHSSTLVTAGIYLLIRFNYLLINTLLSKILLLISVLTMFMAGLGANYEFDLKKIIALSTLSQLGLMMSILSMGYAKLAFFHLLTHALFKALLFMCAGYMIHNMNNNQDIRLMGNLLNMMPLTISCLNISNLALCGMPFLSGFYSKDLILEMVSLSYLNIMIFIMFFLSTGLTVSYSFRLVYYTLTGMMNYSSINLINNNYLIMMKSMMGLIFLVMSSGSLLSWLIIPTPLMICLPMKLKLLTLMVSLMGGYLGYELNQFKLSWKNNNLINFNLINFLGSMWFMPMISTMSMNNIFLMMSYYITKNMDQGWNEYLGGQSIYNFMKLNSKKSNFIELNKLNVHLMSFIFWIILLIMIYMY
uniref:NADH-ubiquinone oxidoreductase chain 5 n=1 Tax=Rapisma zayuanum TaxID=1419480 RepID=V9PNS6_9NEOP|nr:NADH dehydrogenase subunit 5 [Rapisma zayuanum]AHA35674.1 NADH dehydrogenase subunit 5 [Rapisma zayuanum]